MRHEILEQPVPQIDSLGFFIGMTVNDWPGALKGKTAPEFDKKTHKARWVDDAWVIKTKEEWEAELSPEPVEE